jgi:hypothetical protein
MLAIQKGCFDEFWDTPFIELIDRIGDTGPGCGSRIHSHGRAAQCQ